MDEALCSAAYVDNYIDSVEDLPHDVQVYVSRIRDMDVKYRKLLREVEHYYDLWQTLHTCAESNASRIVRTFSRIQQNLIQAQQMGDEKMKVVSQLQELIDFKTRQLDIDQTTLHIEDEKEDVSPAHLDDSNTSLPQKQMRTQSPSRFPDQNVLPAAFNNNAGSNNNNNNSINLAATNSSTNYDKTSANASINSNTSNGSASGSNLVGSVADSQRSYKRSRRRHDTGGNMELGGNESNSAGETINGERSTGLKSNTGIAQRKNSLQSQGTTSNNITNVGSNCSPSNAAGSSSTVNNTGGAGKKKKRKARGGQSSHSNAREDTPPPDPIDPDEPTYCVCNQISFGEMILCDNDLCPIEWFHFSCVSLVLKPKGKWYCPNCRGDRPNVMKPKAQFLKELVRYNKEKEEKT